MNHTFSILMFFFIIGLISPAISQGYNNTWILSPSSDDRPNAINFNDSPPTFEFINNVIEGGWSIISISDIDGNLIFYSKGNKIYNIVNEVMSNSNDIRRDMLVVPLINDQTKYYIFHSERQKNGQGSTILNYSILDMSLDNGLGDIQEDQKNTLLTRNIQGLIASPGECNDVWVITYNHIEHKFFSYHISEGGIDIVPSFSPISLDFTSYTHIKASPDGSRIAVSQGDLITIFDFDPKTGIVSNPLEFPSPVDSLYTIINTTFSPNSDVLYINFWNFLDHKGQLLQYNLKVDSYVTVLEGEVIRDVQTGPNNLVYFIDNGGKVGVINQPDKVGDECELIDSIASLQGAFFPKLVVTKPQIHLLPNDPILCSGDSIKLYVREPDYPLLWQDFIKSDTLLITQPGTYYVQSIGRECPLIDSVDVELNRVDYGKSADLSICEDENVMINVSVADDVSVTWEDGSNIEFREINSPATYSFTISDSLCTYNDSIVVSRKANCSECDVFVPNIFSPNNDGINDEYLIQSGCTFEIFELSIYDRWGNQVFFSNDDNRSWSNRKTEIISGVYLYLFKYRMKNDTETSYLNGDITVVN